MIRRRLRRNASKMRSLRAGCYWRAMEIGESVYVEDKILSEIRSDLSLIISP